MKPCHSHGLKCDDALFNSLYSLILYSVNCVPNDTLAALLYMKNLFPMEKFDDRIPPIVMKHQLYSIVKNRTIVDKQVVRFLYFLLMCEIRHFLVFYESCSLLNHIGKLFS